MLRWTQAQLAVESNVARKTVADFENRARRLHYRTQLALTTTLAQAGVMFIWDGSEGVHLPSHAIASSLSTQAAVSASAPAVTGAFGGNSGTAPH